MSVYQRVVNPLLVGVPSWSLWDPAFEGCSEPQWPDNGANCSWRHGCYGNGNRGKSWNMWEKYGKHMERMCVLIQFEDATNNGTIEIQHAALLVQLALGVLCLMHFVHYYTAPPESFTLSWEGTGCSQCRARQLPTKTSFLYSTSSKLLRQCHKHQEGNALFPSNLMPSERTGWR